MRNRILNRFSHALARMRRDGRSGSAAIEFAMVAPVLFLFLFGIIETGVLFFASATLQNATDATARLIRTGQLTGAVTASTLKNYICGDISGLISASNCAASLQIDVRAFSSFSAAGYPSITKSDGTVDTSKLTVQSTASCDVVLIRSFYPWKIMTPLMTPLLENTSNGEYLLSAAAAFRAEPYVSGTSC